MGARQLPMLIGRSHANRWKLAHKSVHQYGGMNLVSLRPRIVLPHFFRSNSLSSKSRYTKITGMLYIKYTYLILRLSLLHLLTTPRQTPRLGYRPDFLLPLGLNKAMEKSGSQSTIRTHLCALCTNLGVKSFLDTWTLDTNFMKQFSEETVSQSMPRREDLSDLEDDDEAIIDKTKKKNKEKKTYVFEIKLSENSHEKYEYNYKEMVKEHEERAKKVDSDIEIIEIIDDDPVPKKKYKKPVPIDPEDDYDLEDDFIDDTEANDEVVPDKVSTEHGGFYINVGRLKYIELEDGVSGSGGVFFINN